MTYNEVKTCQRQGLSARALLEQLAAVHASQLRADAALIERAYAPQPVPRPAYPSEAVYAPRVAYDYNGR